jgi:hypothetical protein
MELLNNLYVQVVNGINTGLRFSRYLIIVVQRSTTWTGSEFIPWLNGHLGNIALGRTTNIITVNEDCHDIFCVISNVIGSITDLLNTVFGGSLDIVNQIVAFIIDVIRLLLGLLIQILGQLFGFGRQAFDAGNTLIGAWNASTQPLGEGELSGAPLIAENPAPTDEAQQAAVDEIDAFVQDLACASGIRQKPVCITIWILENTLFGNGRQAVLWIVVAICLIEYLLWLLEAIPGVIDRVRSSL